MEWNEICLPSLNFRQREQWNVNTVPVGYLKCCQRMITTAAILKKIPWWLDQKYWGGQRWLNWNKSSCDLSVSYIVKQLWESTPFTTGPSKWYYTNPLHSELLVLYQSLLKFLVAPPTSHTIPLPYSSPLLIHWVINHTEVLKVDLTKFQKQ